MEGASYESNETPPSFGQDPPVVQNDDIAFPHVDLPTGSGARAEAWRVTADVVVKMDGTPVRMLSCTVDTQWHGTTVRTLPLRDSLLAGLSLAEDERLVQMLRIVPGEEAIRCLGGGTRALDFGHPEADTSALCYIPGKRVTPFGVHRMLEQGVYTDCPGVPSDGHVFG